MRLDSADTKSSAADNRETVGGGEHSSCTGQQVCINFLLGVGVHRNGKRRRGNGDSQPCQKEFGWFKLACVALCVGF